jgi:hypothetical protein
VSVTAAAQALSEDELAVVRATDRNALAGLDEDALLDLHAQIRRARTKYVGQYRRQASARVSDTGGRGKARPQNQRARDKAEIFEAALARVSTALAKAARESAAQLRADRIATAKAARMTGPSAATKAPRTPVTADKRPPQKSGGRLKRDASDIAVGRRKQARKDNR